MKFVPIETTARLKIPLRQEKQKTMCTCDQPKLRAFFENNARAFTLFKLWIGFSAKNPHATKMLPCHGKLFFWQSQDRVLDSQTEITNSTKNYRDLQKQKTMPHIKIK